MSNYWNDRDDYSPCFWLRGYPVYVTTLLVAIQVIALLIIAIMMATGQMQALAYLGFSASEFSKGQVWRLFTYPLLNFPDGGLLFFAIMMFMLYQFGREVERFLGLKRFLLLYGALVLVAPVILLISNFFAWPEGNKIDLLQMGYTGSDAINFGVFIAFAVLYPNVQVFFSLTARWVAIILMAIVSVQCIAASHWKELAVFLGVCAAAALMMRRFRGMGGFLSYWMGRFNDAMRSRHSARHLKNVQKPFYTKEPEEIDEEDLHASIDPLLDKIAKHGVASLTPKEKERLERVRESLLHKERKN